MGEVVGIAIGRELWCSFAKDDQRIWIEAVVVFGKLATLFLGLVELTA